MFNEMKRREFLKGSAMGVSALAAGLSGGAPARRSAETTLRRINGCRRKVGSC